MRKIAFMTLFSLPLFAGFFPPTIQTSVHTVSPTTISVNTAFPATGMSGVVVHHYANGLSAITSRIVQTKNQKTAALLNADLVHHDKLPTIKTTVQKGDKVIAGYLYNNVLLLAPDEHTYAKLTKMSHKKWIHPDLYAIFLSTQGESSPSRENLAQFAREYQVGLIYIVRQNDAILLDPISGKIVSKRKISNLPKIAQFPFYMHFDKLETGWFGREAKGSYYPTMGAI
jgi:hypothetical protein